MDESRTGAGQEAALGNQVEVHWDSFVEEESSPRKAEVRSRIQVEVGQGPNHRRLLHFFPSIPKPQDQLSQR